MTIDEIHDLIQRIGETGGFTDEMLDDLRKLRDEFDERAGEIDKLGETRDQNPPDGFDTWDAAYSAMRDERDAERRRYVARFLGGEEKADEPEVSDDDEPDDKPKEYDDLFKKKED